MQIILENMFSISFVSKFDFFFFFLSYILIANYRFIINYSSVEGALFGGRRTPGSQDSGWLLPYPDGEAITSHTGRPPCVTSRGRAVGLAVLCSSKASVTKM